MRRRLYYIIIIWLMAFPGLIQNLHAQETDTVYTETAVDTSVQVTEAPAEEGISTEAVNNRYFSRNDEYDQFKPEFRKSNGNTVSSLKAEEDFWYADLKPKRKNDKPEEQPVKRREIKQRTSFTDTEWFQTLLWFVIITGFAVCVGIFLSNNNVSFFRRRNVVIQTGKAEEELEDIFAIQYDKQIEKACQAGNYRLAVRLHYLRMLKQMAEKQVIQYKQDRTNFDYMMQLQGTRYYDSYFRITRDYEYSWYGEFPVSEETYQLIRADFGRMDKTLNGQ